MKKLALIVVLVLIIATSLFAQDAALVSPDYYTVLFENDFVRVLDFNLPVLKSDNQHSHPDSLIFYLEDSQVRVYRADGSIKEATLHKHNVFFQKATTHRVENIGQTVVRAISFEFRQPTGAPDTVTLHPAVVDPVSNSVLLDNQRCRVVYTVTQPGDISGLHEHMPMVVYAVTPAKLEVTTESGDTRTIEVPAGAVIFSAPVKHRVANIGENQVVLLHVEIK